MSSMPAPPCEMLPWDSKFFARRIARVKGHQLTGTLAKTIDQWAQQNQVECLYFLAGADDPQTLRSAPSHGYQLVDIRMTFEHGSAGGTLHASGREPSLSRIRQVRPDDLPALQVLARRGHRDTRFFSDPGFFPERSEELYSTWVSLECQGRAAAVLVAASSSDQPQGYISCHLEGSGSLGQIGLVGVAPETRGQGIGKALVLAALDWFDSKGAAGVSVVTQGRNVSAQRLYQRCGFVTSIVQLWYHKWFQNSPENVFK